MRLSSIPGLSFGLWLLLSLSAQAAPLQTFVPGQVIVKFRTSAAATALKSGKDVLEDTLEGVQLQGVDDLPYGMNLLTFIHKGSLLDSSAATLEVIAQLNARPDVEFAHPNHLYQLSRVPNDSLYAQQWHYPLIQLPQAWDVTTGAAGIRIAILDTGTTQHPEIQGRWVPGLEFNAADQNGDAQDVGYPRLFGGGRVFWRHGTHVAGIAGGASNNRLGSAGVCWGCRLLPVKVSSSLRADGNGQPEITDQSLIRGIEWAVANGARVINMSLEFNEPCNTERLLGLRIAVAAAIASNVTVVVAAGNQNRNAAETSPASCPGVIAVAATTRTNARAPYSNFGAVTLAAPGGGGSFGGIRDGYGTGIGCPEDADSSFTPSVEGAVGPWVTSSDGDDFFCYRHLSGTSMAAPHVAGVVGLVLSVNPSLRPAEITQLLRETAQPLPGCGAACGAGLVNAFAAVQEARGMLGPCGWAPAGQPCSFDSLSHDVSGPGGFEETVVAYGRMWKFNLAGQRIGRSVDLRSIPRYANGPCAWAPAGQPCRIDSATTLDYPGLGYVESVTAYGRYWNFDAWGNAYAGSGSDLRSVARYANGPCLFSEPWMNCTMDTRNLIDLPAWGGVNESITGYARYWIFNAAGNLIEEAPLQAIPRYASGPCLFASWEGGCTFDTRELANVPGQGLVETITAYGRYWQFDGAFNPLPGSGALLSSIPRFQ